MKYLFILAFLLTACTPAIKTFSWIEGTWEMPTKRGFLYEKWDAVKSNSMKGESYRVSDGETIPMETIQIKLEKGDFWYIPTVSGQNEGLPVPYKLASVENNSRFTFENKEHDFPQRIIYEFRPILENRKMQGDTLLAKIEGESKGQYRTSTFQFIRI